MLPNHPLHELLVVAVQAQRHVEDLQHPAHLRVDSRALLREGLRQVVGRALEAPVLQEGSEGDDEAAGAVGQLGEQEGPAGRAGLLDHHLHVDQEERAEPVGHGAGEGVDELSHHPGQTGHEDLVENALLGEVPRQHLADDPGQVGVQLPRALVLDGPNAQVDQAAEEELSALEGRLHHLCPDLTGQHLVLPVAEALRGHQHHRRLASQRQQGHQRQHSGRRRLAVATLEQGGQGRAVGEQGSGEGARAVQDQVVQDLADVARPGVVEGGVRLLGGLRVEPRQRVEEAQLIRGVAGAEEAEHLVVGGRQQLGADEGELVGCLFVSGVVPVAQDVAQQRLQLCVVEAC